MWTTTSVAKAEILSSSRSMSNRKGRILSRNAFWPNLLIIAEINFGSNKFFFSSKSSCNYFPKTSIFKNGLAGKDC